MGCNMVFWQKWNYQIRIPISETEDERLSAKKKRGIQWGSNGYDIEEVKG